MDTPPPTMTTTSLARSALVVFDLCSRPVLTTLRIARLDREPGSLATSSPLTPPPPPSHSGATDELGDDPHESILPKSCQSLSTQIALTFISNLAQSGPIMASSPQQPVAST